MSQTKTAFVLLVTFFAGCAAERILVVPSAQAGTVDVPPARAGTTPQRWEYFCTKESGETPVMRMANEASRQGWEMVGMGAEGLFWCFKRPLP